MSGSDHRMHFKVFFIMEEFCSRKKGRRRRRMRSGYNRRRADRLETVPAHSTTPRLPLWGANELGS